MINSDFVLIIQDRWLASVLIILPVHNIALSHDIFLQVSRPSYSIITLISKTVCNLKPGNQPARILHH